jgi:hypothetical protein
VQEKTVVDVATAHCCYAMEEVMIVVVVVVVVAVVWADHVALSKRFLSWLIE